MTFQVKSADGSITALHGRFGDIIFRTRKATGKVYVTFSPKKRKKN